VTILARLVAADIWLMRKLGGKPMETLSSAAWNAHITGRFFGFTYHFIDLGFYIWERDHCRKDHAHRIHIYQQDAAHA
jgi:hypothetical protein